MEDQFQRKIEYARISITDRCNLRCRYCRPDHQEILEHNDILTYEELLQICEMFCRLGIRRFKVTGGEPLVRRGCLSFIRRLKQLPGAKQVTLTTNGTLLRPQISKLREMKIDGINISLDTLDPEKYRQITGSYQLDEVLTSIDAAWEAEIPVKINKVLLPEDTMEDLWPFVERFMEKRKIPVRLIEQMSFGNQKVESSVLTGEIILKAMQQKGRSADRLDTKLGNGPASYYRIQGAAAPLGLIEAVHGNFCTGCNRIRLTSAGWLKPCLYSSPTLSLRDLLRNGRLEEEILQKIRKEIFAKPASHHFGEKPSAEEMYQIGG